MSQDRLGDSTPLNYLQAMKLKIEEHIQLYIVDKGHCKPGELVAAIAKGKDGVEVVGIMSTTDRKVEDILKAAFPAEFQQKQTEAFNRKRKQDQTPRGQMYNPDAKPTNRAERRAQERWSKK